MLSFCTFSCENVLAEEGRVELRNFGDFAVKKRMPRQGRSDGREGQPIKEPEAEVLVEPV